MTNQGPVVEPVVICVRASKVSSFSSTSSANEFVKWNQPDVAKQKSNRAAIKLENKRNLRGTYAFIV